MTIRSLLLKFDLGFIAGLALLALSMTCAGAMKMGWADPVPPLAAMIAHCPRCYSLPAAVFQDMEITAVLTYSLHAILAGMAIFSLSILGSRLWKYRLFAIRLTGAVLAGLPRRLDRIAARLNLSQSLSAVPEAQPRAFCYGLLSPRICVSTGLVDALSDTEVEAVLWHERHHQLTYAPLRLFLADTLSTIFFFLPIIGELRDMLVVSIELAADRYAVERAGRSTLASALYRLLDHPLGSTSAPPRTTIGLSVTSVRIAELLGERAHARRVSTRSLMISAGVIMILCLLVPVALS